MSGATFLNSSWEFPSFPSVSTGLVRGSWCFTKVKGNWVRRDYLEIRYAGFTGCFIYLPEQLICLLYLFIFKSILKTAALSDAFLPSESWRMAAAQDKWSEAGPSAARTAGFETRQDSRCTAAQRLCCRSQGSVWFCRKSFYHHSTVETLSSSPPSRHGNLNVCVCEFVSLWENKGGWMWLEQILITTAPHKHTHTSALPAALHFDGILMPICFQLSPFMRCGNGRLLMVNSDI